MGKGTPPKEMAFAKGRFLGLRRICAALSSKLDGALPGTEVKLCPVRLRTGIFVEEKHTYEEDTLYYLAKGG